MQGAEKLVISKMLVENSNRRSFPVDRHAGVAIAGVAADGRAIVNRAMAEASQYKSFYGDPIPGHVLAERLGTYVHVFNLYWWALCRSQHVPRRAPSSLRPLHRVFGTVRRCWPRVAPACCTAASMAEPRRRPCARSRLEPCPPCL